MAHRWLVLPVILFALAAGCGMDASVGGPRGGSGGAGGVGGSEWIPACMTGPLCGRCPDQRLCVTQVDCEVGHVCVESGCSENDGAPIRHCMLAPAGFCHSSEDCMAERECISVPGEGKRCVKTTPGCNTSFDCVPGFSCEDGSCVDRRVPCFLDQDCPKSHFCHAFDATRFCMRVQQSCEVEFDCPGLAPLCVDIDGDGNAECSSAFDPHVVPPQACVNSICSGTTPVCEVGDDSAFTYCGQYGLCKADADCAGGFDCLPLWPDGRSECVPEGGSCSELGDCPVRQVCASARAGGPPSCQAGAQPL